MSTEEETDSMALLTLAYNAGSRGVDIFWTDEGEQSYVYTLPWQKVAEPTMTELKDMGNALMDQVVAYASSIVTMAAEEFGEDILPGNNKIHEGNIATGGAEEQQ